jgi:hypothetical protein
MQQHLRGFRRKFSHSIEFSGEAFQQANESLLR